jgi:nucleoside-diphosphate-sugar epimerase
VIGDIRQRATAEELCDDAGGASVFHAAAVIHPTHVSDFFETNVEGTALLIEAASKAEVRRLVYVSSNSPFGVNPTPLGVFEEESLYHPYLGYGQSKMQAELLVQKAAAAGEIETTTVRAPWFYGPHQPERQSRFFGLIRAGRFPIIGPGTNSRSMVYTENLADGLVRAELHEIAAGRAYWIADARPYELQEIVSTVREVLEEEGLAVKDRQLRLPGFIAEVAGAVDAGLQYLGRYRQELHVLGEVNKTIVCSIDRAHVELGYQPAVDLREGMRRSIRWCIINGVPI